MKTHSSGESHEKRREECVLSTFCVPWLMVRVTSVTLSGHHSSPLREGVIMFDLLQRKKLKTREMACLV